MADYQEKIDLIIRDICEFDDRTSPEDYPHHLLVLPEELDMVIKRHFVGDEPTEVEALSAEITKLKTELKMGNGIILYESDIDKAIAAGPQQVKDIVCHVKYTITAKALLSTHGNISQAADLIGWNRATFKKCNVLHLVKLSGADHE